jgi:hypothetical protein
LVWWFSAPVCIPPSHLECSSIQTLPFRDRRESLARCIHLCTAELQADCSFLVSQSRQSLSACVSSPIQRQHIRKEHGVNCGFHHIQALTRSSGLIGECK